MLSVPAAEPGIAGVVGSLAGLSGSWCIRPGDRLSHRGLGNTKALSSSVFTKKNIFKHEALFWVIATLKTRHVQENKGGTQWKESGGHAEKVMFLSHDFIIMIP